MNRQEKDRTITCKIVLQFLLINVEGTSEEKTTDKIVDSFLVRYENKHTYFFKFTYETDARRLRFSYDLCCGGLLSFFFFHNTRARDPIETKVDHVNTIYIRSVTNIIIKLG